MNKYLLSFTVLVFSIFSLKAQDCDIPQQFNGNTGSNMTIMLLASFIQELPVIEDESYIVAIAESGMIIGSEILDGSSQTSITIWGDDTFTPSVDGAISDEPFVLQFVSVDNLYSLDYSSNLLYISNSVAMLDLVQVELIDCSIVPGCTSEWAENYVAIATEDDGSCFLNACLDQNATNYNGNATIADNSCLYSQNYTNSLQLTVDSLELLSIDNDQLINTLESDLSFALNNQEDGVSQADLDAVQSQLTILEEQLVELAANSLDAQVLYFENQIDLDNPSQYDIVVQAYGTLADAYQFANPNVYGQISIELQESWNTVGYNLIYETTPNYQFDSISDDLVLVKDNNGNIYWPQFNFNGIGNLIPGHGYQLRMDNPATLIFVE